MPKIDQILAEVERLVETVKPQEAENRLRALIGTIGDEELKAWEADLRLTIAHFLPKRRKSLLLVLGRRLNEGNGGSSVDLKPPRREPEARLDLEKLRADFVRDLSVLSERHIYSWSTFYRDTLSVYFERFLAAAENDAELDEVLRAIREPLAAHSEEICDKGFR